jgi:hypothetical protein
MSSGGARYWRNRPRASGAGAMDSASDEEVVSEQEQEDVPIVDGQPQARRRQEPSVPGPSVHDNVLPIGNVTIMHESTYRAVKDVFSPCNEVKSKTGEILLKQASASFKRYSGIDLDGEVLEIAACGLRCGGAECLNHCCVFAFVVSQGYGTDFFFGPYEDVVHAAFAGSVAEVYIWDDLEEGSMSKLRRMLDAVMEANTGLAMRQTELKTVPGKVSCPLRTHSLRTLKPDSDQISLSYA